MVNFLIDTSTIVQFLRGTHATKQIMAHVAHKGELAISVISLGELLYGAHRSENYEREKGKVFHFLDDFSINVAPLTSEIVSLYAGAKYTLETKGKKLDELDLLIGTTAVASGSTLVTDNVKHFRRIPGIVLAEGMPIGAKIR